MNEYVDIIVNAVPDYVDVVVDRLPDYVEVINEQVIERVVEVEPFTKTLSGYSVSVLQSEHGLSTVRGLRVCKPTGQAVEVLETFSGNDIQIDSNVLLDDHILTIF